MKTKKVYPCVPPGCVEIKLPRVIFPKEVTQPLANANDNPWHSVDEWSLVVCPSDMTVRVGTENFGDHYEYSAIWSLLSGKVYEWGDYYTHGPAPKSREVGCVDVLISCIPNKDHCEPPEKVYLYTTTQGVVRPHTPSRCLRSIESWSGYLMSQHDLCGSCQIFRQLV